jgi:hypothetical protein
MAIQKIGLGDQYKAQNQLNSVICSKAHRSVEILLVKRITNAEI